MADDVYEVGNFTNITDADSPKTITGARRMIGILCNSTTTGTFAVTDTEGNTVTGTITPAEGAFARIPASFTSDPIITMTNTIDLTIFWGN